MILYEVRVIKCMIFETSLKASENCLEKVMNNTISARGGPPRAGRGGATGGTACGAHGSGRVAGRTPHPARAGGHGSSDTQGACTCR